MTQTDTINDPERVPSTAVTYALGQEVDTLNNNLADVNRLCFGDRIKLITQITGVSPGESDLNDPKLLGSICYVYGISQNIPFVSLQVVFTFGVPNHYIQLAIPIDPSITNIAFRSMYEGAFTDWVIK